MAICLDPSTGLEFELGLARELDGDMPDSRIWGVRRFNFFSILALVALVIGGIVGGILGGRKASQHENLEATQASAA